MPQGLNAATFRKLTMRDNLIDAIIRDIAAERGLALTNELPPEKSHADLLKKAGARTVSVASL